MLRVILIAAAVGMLSGCVSTKTIPMKAETIARIQGGTLAVTKREKPGFAAMTAGKAMFGAVGGAAMVMAGNKIVEENAIEDPALRISAELMKGFADVNAMSVVSTDGIIASGVKPTELAKQYSNANVLLDIQTINWSFVYFPTDWNSYRVIYSAKMRVIDTKEAKLLAEGFCSRVPENSAEAPSHDELLENQAARLKQELAIAADHCIQEFRSKVLMQTDVRTASSPQ
jgi:hypothetical protein